MVLAVRTDCWALPPVVYISVAMMATSFYEEYFVTDLHLPLLLRVANVCQSAIRYCHNARNVLGNSSFFNKISNSYKVRPR